YPSIIYHLSGVRTMSHSLQYVYSGTSGIWNLPEFMIVRLVDGEPFVHYDSNSHKMTPLQEWMAKSEGPDYWNTESQVAMSDELAFENNIEVAKQRFNQTGGIHTLQVMYSCEWDDETGATGVSVYGYDGSDFLTLDLKTMTYVAPVMQAVPTKLNWNSGRAFLEGQKAYHTHICIEWLKKYVSYGKSTLERTVRPEVSLLQKDPSSPVTCHATGFFPKGIVVTWRKDGVDMHSDVEVGETLPNGNGHRGSGSYRHKAGNKPGWGTNPSQGTRQGTTQDGAPTHNRAQDREQPRMGHQPITGHKPITGHIHTPFTHTYGNFSSSYHVIGLWGEAREPRGNTMTAQGEHANSTHMESWQRLKPRRQR
uniref:Ig-like domain-containing protein n=1 Tax=Paramormyrops kingsleyae TaxID=1676925 RepID=A0A3B3QFL2_9TELE